MTSKTRQEAIIVKVSFPFHRGVFWPFIMAVLFASNSQFSCLSSAFVFPSRTYNPTKRHHFLTPSETMPFIFRGNVTILEEGEHYVVVSKPPSIVCHHSDWTGSRRPSSKRDPHIPMLQRTREAIGERVNLVHRLDRGASGCLLMTKAASEEATRATAILQQAMADPSSRKTYIALVRGEGILNGVDLQGKGWFTVDRPIKDELGNLNNATTHFRFIAGQDNGSGTIDRPRASLVLARPETGRWHQIRRHLNGLSHPILGDSTHGDNQLNRSWRNERGMLAERTCLHLVKLEIPPQQICPQGITVSCPLAPDMMVMLKNHLPTLLEDAQVALEQEGIDLGAKSDSVSEVPIEFIVNM